MHYLDETRVATVAAKLRVSGSKGLKTPGVKRQHCGAPGVRDSDDPRMRAVKRAA